MSPTRTDAVNGNASTDELAALLASWRRSLRAQRASPNTIATYGTAVERLGAFLATQGMPTSPSDIRREHVEAFIEHLLAHYKPATAHNRYRGCAAFFAWLVREWLKDSPLPRKEIVSRLAGHGITIRESGGDMARLKRACGARHFRVGNGPGSYFLWEIPEFRENYTEEVPEVSTGN